MWIADNWKDYEVLDTSGGEKLERWGDYILVRPDPQVIWNTPHEHSGWKNKNGHYHRSIKGGGEWEFFKLPNEWTISYDLSSIYNIFHCMILYILITSINNLQVQLFLVSYFLAH